MSGIVVEFVGLSGAGKSTLSRRAAQLMRARGWPCSEHYRPALKRSSELLFSANELFGNPRYVLSSLRAIMASEQRSISEAVMLSINWLCQSFLNRRCALKRGIHLLDQSVFQVVWSIGFHARSRDWPGRLLSLGRVMPLPDLTVIVDGSATTIQRRLLARQGGRSRLQQLISVDASALNTAVSTMDLTKQLIGRISDQCRSMQVLVIDNDQDAALEKNAERIVESVRRLLQNR